MTFRLPRREFLAASAASALVSLTPSVPQFLLRAAEQASSSRGDRLLVVLQLTGGNDGLNTVVPFRDEEYRRRRPTLAIGPNQVLKLNDDLGLHPSLGGLHSLWDAGQLAVVQGIGYPNPNRSHFESMDIWHTARFKADARAVGWLGRYLDASANNVGGYDARAIHIGPEVQPLALAGATPPAASLRSVDQFRLTLGADAAGRRKRLEEMVEQPSGSGNDLLQFVRTTTLSALKTSRQVEAAAAQRATSVPYPGSELGNKLETIARLVDAGLNTRVYYVSLDGFDTHATQPAAHAALMQQWGDAVKAFYADLAQRGHAERVLTLTFSEFGRRVEENASLGTDHGAAAPLFVMGPAVKAGIVGRHPSLTDLDDGDLKFNTDFRQVYASILDGWLNCPAEPILDGQFAKLPLLRT